MAIAQELRSVFGVRFHENEPLAHHTNFRIGGPARFYVEARTAEEIRAAVDAAQRAQIPWFALGGGSNTLVGDTGFDGLVVQVALRDVRVDGTRVIAGAGAITAAVARQAGEAGLTGFEWAVSLPGTIGGAVRGNAGCFGGEMKDVMSHVRVLSIPNSKFQIPNLTKEECAFAYRYSIFKAHPEWIVLEATLVLQAGDPMESRMRMDAYLERRKFKQPLERPSAGCLFKNVEERELDDRARERLDAADIAWRTVVHDSQLPSGWLIQQAGCSGLRIGNAMVSEKHGNFAINLGGATAADVVALADAARARVRAAFGVELHDEVQRLGC